MTRPMKCVMRVFLTVFALAAIVGAGFYLRPVSYFNARTYLQEHFDGFENHSVKVEAIACITSQWDLRAARRSFSSTAWAATPRTGGNVAPVWPKRVSASTCPT